MSDRRTRKNPPPPRRPKAKAPRLLDVTGMRQDIDYARLSERVDVLDGRVTDHDEGIKQIKADAAQWGGLNQRLKAVENKPDPVVVDKDGKVVPVPVGTIVAAFLIHDLAVGALIFGAYWYARGAGWL